MSARKIIKYKSELGGANPKVDKSINLEDLTLNQLIQLLLSRPKVTYYSALFLGMCSCIYFLLVVLYFYAEWPCAPNKAPIDGFRLMVCGAGEIFPLNLFIIFFLLPILIIWGTICLYKKDGKGKLPIAFTYSFNDASWSFFVKLNDALLELSKSQYIWILEASGSESNYLDKSERFVAKSMFEDPSILNIELFYNASRANIKLFTLATESKKLIFLPTKLIIIGDKLVSVFNYEDLRIQSSIVKIAEGALQPTDAVKNGSILMYLDANKDLIAGKSKKLQLFNYEEIIIGKKDVQEEVIHASQEGAFFKLTQVLNDQKRLSNDSSNIRPFIGSVGSGRVSGAIPSGISWCKKNEATQIYGISIPRGMIYVGSLNPEEVEGLDRNSSFINIRLDVSHDFIDFSQRRFGYYPEYSAISPDARKAYLLWLASGCASTYVNIGYVFLYYYGLERRALMDLSLEDDSTELLEIQFEIRRLISIYSENRSFKSYANNLITFLDESFRGLNQDLKDCSRFVGLNSRLREAANSQDGLSAELALEWVLATPECSQRPAVVGSRYQFIDEFKRLYRHIKIDSDVVLKTVAPIIKYKAAAAELRDKEFSRPCGISSELYPLPRDIIAVFNASCDALGLAKVAADSPVGILEREEKILNTKAIPSRLAHHFADNNQHQTSAIDANTKQTATLNIELDEERIVKIRKETGDVSKILTAIFEDAEYMEPPLILNGLRASEGDSYSLDDSHLYFLKAVKIKSSWTRSDFQELSKKLGVMMSGAIESINDVFLDKFDLPLFEGDDPITINQELLGKLKL